MTKDQRELQLQQLANVVIDAYVNRESRFVPDFRGSRVKIFLARPEGEKDHPKLEVNFVYWRDDYEEEHKQ